MLRAKRRRTRTHDKAGNPIFNTMNSTPLQSVYTNKNNNLQQLQNCRCKLCNQDYYFKKSIKIELYGTEDYDPNIVHILGEYELIGSAEMVYFNEIENKYLGFYSSKINDITAIDDATFEPVIGISESYPSANINAVWYVMDVEGNFIKNTDSNIWSMAAIVSNITDNIYSNLVLNTNIVITPFKISLCGCSNCEIKEDDNGNITARCCKGAPQRNPIKGYRKQLLYTGKPVKRNSVELELYGNDGHDIDISNLIGEYIPLVASKVDPIYYNRVSSTYIGFYKSNLSNINNIPGSMFPPIFGIGYNYPSKDTIANWYILDKNGNFISINDDDIWSLAAVKNSISSTINSNLVFANLFDDAISKTINVFCNHPLNEKIQKRALPLNTVYKDNYAKICGAFRKSDVIGLDEKGNIVVTDTKAGKKVLCGYPQVIKRIQNRNGWINDKYNYSHTQYLQRRCRRFRDLEFNFKGPYKTDSLKSIIMLEIYGKEQYNKKLINILGTYESYNNDNTIYYNKKMNKYIGFYSSEISSIPNNNDNLLSILGISNDIPSSTVVAEWYIMDQNGNFMQNLTPDIWSMALIVTTPEKDIFSNLVLKTNDHKFKTACYEFNTLCDNIPRGPNVISTGINLQKTGNGAYDTGIKNIIGNYEKLKDQPPIYYNKKAKKYIGLYTSKIDDILNQNANFNPVLGISNNFPSAHIIAEWYIMNQDGQFLLQFTDEILSMASIVTVPSKDIKSNLMINLKKNVLCCAKKGYTVCEATNNNCKAVYKRSNPRFSRQGAVSGGSRINRLKYQTKLKAQSRRMPVTGYDGKNKTSAENKRFGPMSFDNHINNVNGYGGAVNGVYPVSLYRNTYPTYKSNLSGVCLGKTATCNGLRQRCKISICHKEEIKYIQLELYGEGGYDPTLISILGTYMAEPDVKDIYYNKEKGVYLGFYSGNIGQVLNPNNLSQSMALGVGNKLPSSDVIANWYIMDIEGSFINNTDDNIWSMAAVVNSPSDTINSNLILNKNIFITRCNKYE